MPSERIRELEEKLAAIQAEGEVSELLVDTLVNLGYAYSLRDLDKSGDYGKQARKLAKQIGYKVGECRSYNVTGLILKFKGDYPEAIEWFKRLSKLAGKIDFKMGESSALGNLGSIHSALGNYDEALDLYSKTVILNEEIHNSDGLVPNYINIGEIHTHLKNYDRALYYYKKALSTVDKDSKSLYLSTFVTSALNSIASTYLSQDVPEGVLDSINESIEIGIKINDTAGLASSYAILGEYHQKFKDYKKSLKSYSKSFDLYESLDFSKEIAESSLNLGRINLISGNSQKALEYLLKGIEIAKTIGSKATEAKGYEYLSELYEARDDYQECFRYYKIYRELYDETLGKNMADNMARMELAHDIMKNEKEAELIRLKNVELKREIEERKRVETALKESEDKFRQLSIEDPLTGVFNRRYLFESGGKIVKRSLQDKSDICLGMLDIDYFKNINDKFGHQTGDYVLREFARVVSRCIRPNDFLARYGGEEFVVLLLNCGMHKATRIMNRINKTIESNSFIFNDLEIPVTVSGGISLSSEVASSDTLSELIKLADRRMYMAKDSGRNKILHQDI